MRARELRIWLTGLFLVALPAFTIYMATHTWVRHAWLLSLAMIAILGVPGYYAQRDRVLKSRRSW